MSNRQRNELNFDDISLFFGRIVIILGSIFGIIYLIPNIFDSNHKLNISPEKLDAEEAGYVIKIGSILQYSFSLSLEIHNTAYDQIKNLTIGNTQEYKKLTERINHKIINFVEHWNKSKSQVLRVEPPKSFAEMHSALIVYANLVSQTTRLESQLSQSTTFYNTTSSFLKEINSREKSYKNTKYALVFKPKIVPAKMNLMTGEIMVDLSINIPAGSLSIVPKDTKIKVLAVEIRGKRRFFLAERIKDVVVKVKMYVDYAHISRLDDETWLVKFVPLPLE